ncbi:hypothetical protein GUJ93_ZPchr0014g47408, partial [Zizania palustris]
MTHKPQEPSPSPPLPATPPPVSLLSLLFLALPANCNWNRVITGSGKRHRRTGLLRPFRDGGRRRAVSAGPIPIALNLMDASVNAKKVSFCGSTGHSRCGEFHRPAWSCRMRDHSLNRSNPFLLQVWFVFPFKYKKSMVNEELFYKISNDHNISSEEEDVLVRSYSNLNVSFGYH